MSEPLSQIERVRRFIFEPVPHHRALGLELLACDPESVTVRLPYRAELVGDPISGVLHGGVITTLLDTTCGCAVFSALDKSRRVATLDLRIDYMRPAHAGRDVIAIAECYRVTKSVAFVRATAHDGDTEKPIATAAGTFAIIALPPKKTDPSKETR